ncbi:hypothetical protein CQA53_09955 [Helicobacter didelphidarum]|uniref:Uncharacterized protein n=1 Tax=Helicobacter didelphidarum TaxID=2040648 RepID=A0A3D8I9D3_9HELI|nr:hypothetical protein [Helicobacter didelphidarum]RDU61576.1 hypothetical protein CQA53_09955 [Helicobacter didelphidarum]
MNNSNHYKEAWKSLKSTLFYLILSTLTILNIIFFYILTFIPFPFFGWITLFILSSIWVYLFAYWIIYAIFKTFNINKKINKLYVALPYPIIMILWFGYSFIPLEWQPSFREFERLCGELKDREIIYNKETYDRMQGKKYGIDVKLIEENISLRIKKAEYQYYEYGTNILYKGYKTYGWLDIGLFAKFDRTLGCDGIAEYKQKIKERGY